jgi:hypothetical protein
LSGYFTIPKQTERFKRLHDIVSHSRNLTRRIQIIKPQQPSSTGTFSHEVASDCCDHRTAV